MGPAWVARVDREDDRAPGRRAVRSPDVGWWTGIPAPGSLVGPGGQIGRFRQLNRHGALGLPEGVAGRVEPTSPSDARGRHVEYGETLFHLVSWGGAEESAASAGAASGEATLAQGTFAVVAPTDGVFYTLPAPDSDPFVRVGDRITAGHPVGLVEVMKTFNQILYGGPGLPETAEVLEVRAEDGAELRAGDVLIVVR